MPYPTVPRKGRLTPVRIERAAGNIRDVGADVQDGPVHRGPIEVLTAAGGLPAVPLPATHRAFGRVGSARREPVNPKEATEHVLAVVGGCTDRPGSRIP